MLHSPLFFSNNEWWHLSQVCTVALPEMSACIFGQAPFPLKDIVSICCNDRIMASHLVLHPHVLAHTNTHTPAHVYTCTTWCTKGETPKPKPSKHISSFDSRVRGVGYLPQLWRESPPSSVSSLPTLSPQLYPFHPLLTAKWKLITTFHWVFCQFCTYFFTFGLLLPILFLFSSTKKKTKKTCPLLYNASIWICKITSQAPEPCLLSKHTCGSVGLLIASDNGAFQNTYFIPLHWLIWTKLFAGIIMQPVNNDSTEVSI